MRQLLIIKTKMNYICHIDIVANGDKLKKGDIKVCGMCKDSELPALKYYNLFSLSPSFLLYHLCHPPKMFLVYGFPLHQIYPLKEELPGILIDKNWVGGGR